MIVVNSKEELKELINQRIKEQGPKCDLNDIDVSKITDMSYLFIESDFNGDISGWDTRNVETMEDIFTRSALGEHEPEWWFRHRE